MDMMRIGFLGPGLMGTGMAMSLARAHPVITTLHRNRAHEGRLLGAGITVLASVEAVAEQADVLFLCLPNAEVVRDVVERVRGVLTPGAMIVDTSTSLPSVTREIAVDLSHSRIALIDAPVTGGPAESEAGTLVSMVGASETDFARVEPFLQLTSKTIVRMGPPGTGHAAKLINNFITQGQAALTVEAMRRCDSVGVDMTRMVEVISASGSRSGTFMAIMPPVVAGHYDGLKFSLENAAKDVRYARAMFADAGVPSRLIEDGLAAFFDAETRDWPPETYVSGLMRKRP
ncbi:NAD(P)-dependent oxidoreductase [Acuticoccus sediminis]|uniref:NAD(P)-dependent oxidoreductase n=1 Tax=Acuticoccus sediminis TaxID=2184697 RepID=UPI001CFEAC09|nr:NAD(P)-dependent oxidoreductase [Acuticoccus sediminis]